MQSVRRLPLRPTGPPCAVCQTVRTRSIGVAAVTSHQTAEEGERKPTIYEQSAHDERISDGRSQDSAGNGANDANQHTRETYGIRRLRDTHGELMPLIIRRTNSSPKSAQLTGKSKQITRLPSESRASARRAAQQQQAVRQVVYKSHLRRNASPKSKSRPADLLSRPNHRTLPLNTPTSDDWGWRLKGPAATAQRARLSERPLLARIQEEHFEDSKAATKQLESAQTFGPRDLQDTSYNRGKPSQTIDSDERRQPGAHALELLQRWDLAAMADGMTNLRKLDKGDGLWRKAWCREDAKAGKSMATKERLNRQWQRALTEYEARQKAGIAPLKEPRGGYAFLKESKNDLSQVDREKFKPDAESRTTHEPSADLVNKTTQGTTGIIAKDLSMPGVISDIARKIAEQVRTQIWHDFQSATSSLGFHNAQEPRTGQENNVFSASIDPAKIRKHVERTAKGEDLPTDMSFFISQPPQLEPPRTYDPSAAADTLAAEKNTAYGHSAEKPTTTYIPQSTSAQSSSDASGGDQSTAPPLGPTLTESVSIGLSDAVPGKGKKTSAPTQTSPKKQKAPLSLMEELFPDKPKQEEDSEEMARSVPRLQIRSERPPLVQSGSKHMSVMSRRQAALKKHREFEELGKEPTVLLLRNASTSLVDDDFRRLIPKGKHIQEWQGNGEYIKGKPASQ